MNTQKSKLREEVDHKGLHPVNWLFNRRMWKTSYQVSPERARELEGKQTEADDARMDKAQAKRERQKVARAKS